MAEFKLLWLSLCVAMSFAFPRYQNLIPNGHNVRNPCDGTLWQGVGHEAQNGAGVRNPFGVDFALNGHSWSHALCRADSDGDGLTNGQELGDPTCHWTTHNNAHLEVPKGHPGICEPVGSVGCSGSWLIC